MEIHAITVDGITCFRKVTPNGDYGRLVMPSEITTADRVTEEIEISTSAIENALREIEYGEELRVLWDYIIYLERLIGDNIGVWGRKK